MFACATQGGHNKRAEKLTSSRTVEWWTWEKSTGGRQATRLSIPDHWHTAPTRTENPAVSHTARQYCTSSKSWYTEKKVLSQAKTHNKVTVKHSNETRTPVAYPPSSAQLDSTPYHCPMLHPGPCSRVWMQRGTDKDIQTHRPPWPIYISPRLRLTRDVITVYERKHTGTCNRINQLNVSKNY